MHLPRFILLQPKSLNEAIELLAESGPRAKLMAGGTDLFPRMKYRISLPEAVVTLKGLPVRDPELTADGVLSLDSLMPLAQVVRSKVICDAAPIIADAADRVGSNQIRHMATVGGNLCQEVRCLYFNQSHSFQFVEPCFKRNGDMCYMFPKGRRCHAVFMSDLAPVLVCLDAELEIASVENRRSIRAAELYSGDPLRPFHLSDGDMVTGISVHLPKGSWGWAFEKLSLRGGLEFAILSVAVILETEDDDETCTRARIAVGAVSPAPLRARKAEGILNKSKLSEDLFRAAAQQVSTEIAPAPHHGFTMQYVRKALEVKALDALNLAMRRVAGHGEHVFSAGRF